MALKPKRSWLTTVARALAFAVVVLDPDTHSVLFKAAEVVNKVDQVVPKKGDPE